MFEYGRVGNYNFFSEQNIELHLPVDSSYIKNKNLRKIIETIDAFVGFSFVFNEDNSVVSIKESLIFHNSQVDMPSIWDLGTGDEFKEFSEEPKKVTNLSEAFASLGKNSDSQRSFLAMGKKRWRFQIDPALYCILDRLRFLQLGDKEIILPLNTSCIVEDYTHEKIKKMIENMGIFVAFSFQTHREKGLLTFLDDNVFGDIAYRDLEYNLKSDSYIRTDIEFRDFIINKDGEFILKKETITVYVSYSTKDSNRYRIANIAEKLTKMPEIHDVLYWEEDMKDDIYRYMNDNIEKCDVMLLFCSQNALNSDPVTMEWQAALKIKKKIIPIFTKESEIPALLSTKLGVYYDKNHFDNNITRLAKIILKKAEFED